MPALFDHYVIVDWSAAARPKLRRDSIWICRHGAEPFNVPTRVEAKTCLEKLLTTAVEAGERVLVGFDFPFGYPFGFAQRLGLKGTPPWRAIWDVIAAELKEYDKNGNNRFCVAAKFNQRISGGTFPFWGCPKSKAGAHLCTTFHRGHREGELAERRLIDRREYMPGAQPCWKLFYNGSVGSQALTGIPIVRSLRDRFDNAARIWPFETGLQVSKDASIVFAEVYPSLWKDLWYQSEDRPKDKVQVRGVARLFSELDQVGKLAPLFGGDPTLSAQDLHRIETEEAWTLGVMAKVPPREHPLRPPGRRGPG